MSAMHGRALPPLPGDSGEALPFTPIDFLMPTGVVIPMQVNPRATLGNIKEDLNREAKKYALFALLKDQGFYNFLGGFVCRIEPLQLIQTSGRLLLVSRASPSHARGWLARLPYYVIL